MSLKKNFDYCCTLLCCSVIFIVISLFSYRGLSLVLPRTHELIDQVSFKLTGRQPAQRYLFPISLMRTKRKTKKNKEKKKRLLKKRKQSHLTGGWLLGKQQKVPDPYLHINKSMWEHTNSQKEIKFNMLSWIIWVLLILPWDKDFST